MGVYRCNPRCYNAISPDCRCQCNGANHGVGEIRARANCTTLGIPLRTTASHRVSVRKARGGKTPTQQGWLFPAGRAWAVNNEASNPLSSGTPVSSISVESDPAKVATPERQQI
jgi:hypothetical protein